MSFSIKKEDLFNALSVHIKDILGDDFNGEILPESTFDEIGFDSIKFIDLVLKLDDLIDVDLEVILSNIDVSTISTVGEFSEALKELKQS